MSQRNIYSDSLVPLMREGGTESHERAATPPDCFLPPPSTQVVLFRAFGIPAVWMSLCKMTQDLLGMWAAIVSALCNHVQWWQWASSLGCRQRPGWLLPKGHEGCSGPAEDVDPGQEKVGTVERPCESLRKFSPPFLSQLLGGGQQNSSHGDSFLLGFICASGSFQ